MIEVQNLKKYFKTVKAVDDISFTAEDGKITGLLGPNGAGKSTTLKMLYTVLEPDSGKALIDGFDSHKESMMVQSSIGVLTHNAGIYERLTARENIRYFGELSKITYILSHFLCELCAFARDKLYVVSHEGSTIGLTDTRHLV